MKSFERIIIFSLLLASFSNKAEGQAYRMELGLSAGRSFYMGDANQSMLFLNEQPSFGILYRYNINGRFSLKANVGIMGISGTTVGNSFEFPNGEEINFNRNLLDAGVQLEINFYEFGMPSYIPGSSRISPYAFFGFGMTGYKAEANRICTNIPFGIGIKMKALPRLNLGCEWSFRKTYADDLDYPDSGGNFNLTDPWLVKSAFNKNNDWYSALLFTLSYDIYGIGSKCYR
jgi:hypothetical protein